MFRPSEIFTPGVFPVHTYVERSETERCLIDALDTRGVLTSVSGPTKTGKTVLVNKVVGTEHLVSVSGSAIRDADDLWLRAGEEVGISSLPRREVIRTLVDEELVLLLDDFHYVSREIQADLARQLKDEVARGLQVVVVNVPHRSDDPIRGNPHLRGRVRNIDLDYWEIEDLAMIARKGFPLLAYDLEPTTCEALAQESLRAPQLMQLLCLEVCRSEGIDEPADAVLKLSLDEADRRSVYEEVAQYTEAKSPFEIVSPGPKTRGTERTAHRFRDGGTGDILRTDAPRPAVEPPSPLDPDAGTQGTRAARPRRKRG